MNLDEPTRVPIHFLKNDVKLREVLAGKTEGLSDFLDSVAVIDLLGFRTIELEIFREVSHGFIQD